MHSEVASCDALFPHVSVGMSYGLRPLSPAPQIEEEEPDALDAFMADEVLPEVKAKAAEAIAAREEARLKLAQERAVRRNSAVSF